MSGAKPAWEIRDELRERELPPVARLHLIKYDRGEDAVASERSASWFMAVKRPPQTTGR